MLLGRQSPASGSPVWLLCLLLLGATLGCTSRPEEPPPNSDQPGWLDLRSYRPERDPAVALSGEWLAVWGRLLTPSELDAYHGHLIPLTVPGQWVSQPGLALPPSGYGAATYRVTVRLARPSAGLALRLPDPKLALRAWVNGKLIASRGVPALSREREVQSFGEYVAPLPDGATTLKVVIQLSNHSYRTGGLRKAPVLGQREVLERKAVWSLAGAVLFFAILLLVAVYHFGISLIAPDSRGQRVLAWNALAVAVHEVLVGGGGAIEAALLPHFPGDWIVRVEYFALYIALYLGVELNSQVFPEESRLPGIRFLKLMGLGIAAIPLLTPVSWFSRTLTAFSVCALFAMLVVVYLLVLAIRHRRPQARFILVALIAYLLANVHDVLAAHGVISSYGEPRAPSLLLYIGAQAFTLAKRFADAGQRVIELNRDLTLTNASIARFVPSKVLAMLKRESIRQVERGDQVALTMEVLFCDIRNFTRLVELMPPGRAFGFINDYLSHMEPAIHDHGGFINQYLGDCIMALYPTGADAAVASAVGMLERLEAFNAGQAHSATPIRVGIGINSGPLILGTIGGQERLDSGVVGDAVNLAARIESLTKLYGTSLLISEHTVARLSQPVRFALRELDRVVPKGRSQSASIFEVLDALPPETRALRLRTREDFERGLSLFRDARLEEARLAFEACLTVDPSDAAARLYVKRCQSGADHAAERESLP